MDRIFEGMARCGKKVEPLLMEGISFHRKSFEPPAFSVLTKFTPNSHQGIQEM